MIKLIKRFIKTNFLLQSPPTLFKSEENGKQNLNHTLIKKFGDFNKDKTFYVIKRTPGTGLFSNVVFVLNHLRIAKQNGFIPVVDMKNFKTIYNEKKKIDNIENSWNYFFENVSNFTLEEVYKSNRVIIISDKFFSHFIYDMENENISNLINEFIFIKKKFIKISDNFKKKFFGKKTLGVHFRGTSYKQSPGHPLPATKGQMVRLVKKIVEKDNIDKIFLSTEEEDYLSLFKKEFSDRIIFLKSPYRSKKNDAFKIYPRLNHRYKLGREVLIETVLLSYCDSFIFLNSNVSSAVIAMNYNKNQKRYKIDNGFNSKNIFISSVLWYLKRFLPESCFGFKKDIIVEKV